MTDQGIAMSGKPRDDDFSNLSLKDLIEARDLYHFHLMSKANVVGTAVGLYLIRDKEARQKAEGGGAQPAQKQTYARTFENSPLSKWGKSSVLGDVKGWWQACQRFSSLLYSRSGKSTTHKNLNSPSPTSGLSDLYCSMAWA